MVKWYEKSPCENDQKPAMLVRLVYGCSKRPKEREQGRGTARGSISVTGPRHPTSATRSPDPTYPAPKPAKFMHRLAKTPSVLSRRIGAALGKPRRTAAGAGQYRRVSPRKFFLCSMQLVIFRFATIGTEAVCAAKGEWAPQGCRGQNCRRRRDGHFTLLPTAIEFAYQFFNAKAAIFEIPFFGQN
jgi:hypothetical protein